MVPDQMDIEENSQMVVNLWVKSNWLIPMLYKSNGLKFKGEVMRNTAILSRVE